MACHGMGKQKKNVPQIEMSNEQECSLYNARWKFKL